MYEILVPQENVNDEEVTVIQVLFENNSKVKKGDAIFEIETTKVNIEIEAPVDGIIKYLIKEGDVLKIGEVLATIDDGKGQTKEKSNAKDDQKNNLMSPNVKISKAALKRAEELKIDLSKIKEGMITISDVEEMAVSSIKENSIVVLGAGGHAKTCIDILRHNGEYQILGILDPKLKIGEMIFGVKVLGDNSNIKELVKKGLKHAVNGVGAIQNPKKREQVYSFLKGHNLNVPNIIHPSAVIEKSVSMGEGNQFMMGAMIGTDVVIKDNCLVNSGSIVSHDCILHDHCHISPGAILAGSVVVGKNSLIGMGTTIYIGSNIGKNSVIYNGLNIFNDVKDNSIVES